MKRILPILVIVVIAATAYAVWTSQRTASAADSLGGAGTIEATNVTVSSQVAGSLRITDAMVNAGDHVEKGQVLFKLDATSLNYQVQQAQAGARAAAQTLQLAKDDDKSTAEIDQDQAALDQANVAVKMAQLQASYAIVKAPISGVALEVPATVGESAVPGGSLAIIGDTAHLTVSIYVPESQIGKVKVGQTGRLTTDSSSGSFPVKVTSVASQAEFTPSSTETKDQRVKLVYEVKLDVSDSSGALKPGMPVDVKL